MQQTLFSNRSLISSVFSVIDGTFQGQLVEFIKTSLQCLFPQSIWKRRNLPPTDKVQLCISNINKTTTQGFFTWCALPNNEWAQAGVETDVVGEFVARGQHYQPVPALLPRLRFGIPTPGSILVGARVLSCCVHPRPGNVLKGTMGAVSFGRK